MSADRLPQLWEMIIKKNLSSRQNLQGKQTAEMRAEQGNFNQLTECVFYRKCVIYTWHTQVTHVSVTTEQLSIMG